MTRAAGAVVLSIATAWVAITGWAGVEQTARLDSPARLSRAAEEYHHWQCLAKMLYARLPAGTVVVVEPRQQGTTDYQRLVEIATPRYRLADTPGPAGVTIRLRAGAGAESCDGTLLLVQP